MRRTARDAFSLVELSVAVGLGVLVLSVAYTAFGLLTRTEAATDRRASKAIVTANLMELLMNDLRSAEAPPTRLGPGSYRIERLFPDAGALAKKEVLWRQVSPTVVTREVAGSRPKEFQFEGPLDPDLTAVKLRLEGPGDVRFVR